MAMPRIVYVLTSVLVVILGILFMFSIHQLTVKDKQEEKKIEILGDNNLEHISTLQDMTR